MTNCQSADLKDMYAKALRTCKLSVCADCVVRGSNVWSVVCSKSKFFIEWCLLASCVISGERIDHSDCTIGSLSKRKYGRDGKGV